MTEKQIQAGRKHDRTTGLQKDWKLHKQTDVSWANEQKSKPHMAGSVSDGQTAGPETNHSSTVRTDRKRTGGQQTNRQTDRYMWNWPAQQFIHNLLKNSSLSRQSTDSNSAQTNWKQNSESDKHEMMWLNQKLSFTHAPKLQRFSNIVHKSCTCECKHLKFTLQLHLEVFYQLLGVNP